MERLSVSGPISDTDFRRQMDMLANAYQELYASLPKREEDILSTKSFKRQSTVRGVKLRSEFRKLDDDMVSSRKRSRTVRTRMISQTSMIGMEVHPDSCFSVDSSSSLAVSMERALIIVFMIDFAYVPFAVAWDLAETPVSMAYLAFAIAFWSIDFIVSVLLRHPVTDVNNFSASKRPCLRPRHVFDLVLIFSDLVYLAFSLVYRPGSSKRSIITRMLPLYRLSRLSRAWSVLAYSKTLGMMSAGDSNGPFTALFLRMLLAFTALNHMLSCVWYMMGAGADSDTGVSWLIFPQFYESQGTLEGSGRGFQYLTSMQFALSLTTPSTSYVWPQNSVEKTTAVIVTLMGIFITALVTSQLSAKLVRLQTSKREQMDREDRLTRFFHENQVPHNLAQHVHSAIVEKATAATKLTAHNLPELGMLPTSIRSDLLWSLFSRILLRHTLFASWMPVFPEVVEELCFKVLCQKVFPRGEEIFKKLGSGEYFYVVQNGFLKYAIDDFELRAEIPVSRQNWVSMVALWCEWTYNGYLIATSSCELCALNAKSAVEVFCLCPEAMIDTLRFAQAYASLTSAEIPGVYPELDIPHERVLLAMSDFSKISISSSLLSSGERAKLPNNTCLLSDIDNGKCVVSLENDGSALRTVPVLVFEIRRLDQERTLYKIATSDSGAFSPCFLLPTCKAAPGKGDPLADTAAEFFRLRLPGLQGIPRIADTFETSSRWNSGRYGIPTLYVKTTLQIEMPQCGQVEADMVEVISESFCLWYRQLNSHFKKTDVFPGLDADNEVIIYAWLSHRDADWFKNINVEVVQRWLNTLDYGDCATEAALHLGPVTRRKSLEIKEMKGKYAAGDTISM